jgi:soluble lytic murein transglycosylase-like protein
MRLLPPLASAAGVLGGLALLTISCTASPASGPGARGGLQSLQLPLSDPAAPALHVSPLEDPFAPLPAAPAPALEPAAEPAPVVPEIAQPLPGGTPYVPEVERWRGPVRQLIEEARAEGRLTGPASLLNEDLVLAVIEQESGGDPNAESWAGARGLLQLMPASFAWIMGIAGWGQDISHLNRDFIFDPNTNLRAGIRFLGAVLEEQGGSIYWALSSYNAGGGQVNQWRAMGYGGVPAWYGGGETANYAPAILSNYAAHRAEAHTPATIFQAVSAPPPAPPPPPPPPPPRPPPPAPGPEPPGEKGGGR